VGKIETETGNDRLAREHASGRSDDSDDSDVRFEDEANVTVGVGVGVGGVRVDV